MVLAALLLNLIAFSAVATFGSTADTFAYECLRIYYILGVIIILLDVLLMMLSIVSAFSWQFRRRIGNRAPIVIFYLIALTMCAQIVFAVYAQWPSVSWTREFVVQGNVGVVGGVCLAVAINAVFGLRSCSEHESNA